MKKNKKKRREARSEKREARSEKREARSEKRDYFVFAGKMNQLLFTATFYTLSPSAKAPN
ncbi:hypothetical protein RJD38_02775 [Vibrio scophthalmi]|uniref:hypothetical protein n=1 Tax=Vibrio scophthalmi TaxID=45658 RepID=UPI00349F1C3E